MPAGILLTSVAEDSDAAAKGVVPGDVLMVLDGVQVTSLDVLEQIVYASAVGDELEAVIYRDGTQFAVTILMGEAKY